MTKKASPAEQRRRYVELYARVPAIECRGACRDTCTEFPVPRGERRLVKAATGKELYADPLPWEAKAVRRLCPLLSSAGQCEAYDVRPLICRLWGVTETMPCNYGCRPAGGKPLLTVRESYALIAEAYAIGGDDRMAAHYRQILAVSDEHMEALRPVMRGMASGMVSTDEARRRGEEIMARLGPAAVRAKPRT